jgi:hypothetical protein
VVILLEGAGGAVLADGRHAHDDLGAIFNLAPTREAGREVGGGEAGLDRVDLGSLLGILSGPNPPA